MWFVIAICSLMATQNIEVDLKVLRRVGEEQQASPMELALALAIAHQENDSRFGVRSIKVADQAQAARVVYNSIRNGQKRWDADGKPGDFVSHFGKRWAEDPKWPDGVRSILQRDTPQDIYDQAKGVWKLP